MQKYNIFIIILLGLLIASMIQLSKADTTPSSVFDFKVEINGLPSQPAPGNTYNFNTIATIEKNSDETGIAEISYILQRESGNTFYNVKSYGSDKINITSLTQSGNITIRHSLKMPNSTGNYRLVTQINPISANSTNNYFKESGGNYYNNYAYHEFTVTPKKYSGADLKVARISPTRGGFTIMNTGATNSPNGTKVLIWYKRADKSIYKTTVSIKSIAPGHSRYYNNAFAPVTMSNLFTGLVRVNPKKEVKEEDYNNNIEFFAKSPVKWTGSNELAFKEGCTWQFTQKWFNNGTTSNYQPVQREFTDERMSGGKIYRYFTNEGEFRILGKVKKTGYFEVVKIGKTDVVKMNLNNGAYGDLVWSDLYKAYVGTLTINTNATVGMWIVGSGTRQWSNSTYLEWCKDGQATYKKFGSLSRDKIKVYTLASWTYGGTEN